MAKELNEEQKREILKEFGVTLLYSFCKDSKAFDVISRLISQAEQKAVAEVKRDEYHIIMSFYQWLYNNGFYVKDNLGKSRANKLVKDYLEKLRELQGLEEQ